MAVFPSNATILFSEPLADSALLGGVPSSPAVDLLVVASLKEKKQQVTSERFIDADIYQLSLIGRASTPAALPNTLKPGTRGTCVLWRLQDGFKVPDAFVSVADYALFTAANAAYILLQGEFFLRAVVQSRFSVQAILGDQIEGHLTTAVAWDEPV